VTKVSSCVTVNLCSLNHVQVVPFGMILTKLVSGLICKVQPVCPNKFQKPSGYGSYGASMPIQQLEQPRLTSSYSQAPIQSFGTKLPQLEQPRLTSTSYGAQQFEQPRMTQSFSQMPTQSFGQISQLEQPRLTSSYGAQQLEQPRMTQSFNQVPSQSFSAPLPQLEQPRSFGSQLEQPRSFGSQLDSGLPTSSYGSQPSLPKPQIWQTPVVKQSEMFTAPKPSGY